MKKIFKVVLMILLIFLSSCFNKETNEKNNKDISKKSEKNIIGIKDDTVNSENIDKLDIKKIEKIKLSNTYISSNRNKKVNLNNLILTEDAILFLKGKCNLLKGNGKKYDGGKLININEEFNLKNEFISGLDDCDTCTIKDKEKIKQMFSHDLSDNDIKISNSTSYKEIISLMKITSKNLEQKLDEYILILILTGKHFDNKKEILNNIFKELNNKNQIDENNLVEMLVFYYLDKKECDGFFKYILNEFNK